jgi:hypothetical protein
MFANPSKSSFFHKHKAPPVCELPTLFFCGLYAGLQYLDDQQSTPSVGVYWSTNIATVQYTTDLKGEESIEKKLRGT